MVCGERTAASSESEQSSGSIELHARSADDLDNNEAEYVVRRLTPKECARLQGFPADWCDDIPHSNSAEYKLWGNGISLPVLLPMMKAMKDVLENERMD